MESEPLNATLIYKTEIVIPYGFRKVLLLQVFTCWKEDFLMIAPPRSVNSEVKKGKQSNLALFSQQLII